MVRILLVGAGFYRHILDLQLKGARAAIDRAEKSARKSGSDEVYTQDFLEVPGALEIPAAISMAAESGRYDAFVALGCVIRGETYHFEIVAGESARALMALSLDDVAIGNGILTVENEAQALERADPAKRDKAGAAVVAALRMLDVKRTFV